MKKQITSTKDLVKDLDKSTINQKASPGMTAPRSDKPGALTTAGAAQAMTPVGEGMRQQEHSI